MRKNFRIGDVVENGDYPCTVCGGPHNRFVTEVGENGDWRMATWEMNGHDYKRISDQHALKLILSKQKIK